MTLHIVRIVGLIALIVLCTFYPFLPGEYDPLAISLSAMAQTLGLAGLLVLPVGIAWLISELKKRARRKRNLGAKAGGYYFALASLLTVSIVAVAAVFGCACKRRPFPWRSYACRVVLPRLETYTEIEVAEKG